MALVSCLCVTNRPEWLPWLSWAYDRQTHSERELIIVDSSKYGIRERVEGARVIRMPWGTHIAHARNVAMQHAHGEAVAWFDDDDWQHPERLARGVAALEAGAGWAASKRAAYVDPVRRAWAPARRRWWFNGAVVGARLARSVTFEHAEYGEDAVWLRAIERKAGPPAPLGGVSHCWMVGDWNAHNDSDRRWCTEPLGTLSHVTGEPWRPGPLPA